MQRCSRQRSRQQRSRQRSFTSSIVTVALATSALVQLNQQDGGKASAAENFDDFMTRAGYSLELWVAVNAHFILGIVALCVAVGLRCWVAFEAIGRIATCFVGSGLLLALSLGLPNGAGLKLPVRYSLLIMRRAFSVERPAPVLVLAVALSVAGGALTVRELVGFVAKAST